MESATRLGLAVAIPVSLTCLSYWWAVANEGTRARVLRGATLTVFAAWPALVAGEIHNGGWGARGFDWLLSLAGAGLVILLSSLLVFERRLNLKRLVARAATVVREDFLDERRPERWPAFPLSLLLVGVFLLWCAAAFAHGVLDNWATFLNHRYLHLLQRSSEVGSWMDRLFGGTCCDPLAATPLAVVLSPVAGSLDHPTTILVMRVLAGFSMIAVALLSRPSHVGGHGAASIGFLAVVALYPDFQFNRTGVFETLFSMLFYINLLLIITLRKTAGYVAVVGLVTGIGVLQKEINVINFLLCLLVLSRPTTDSRSVARLHAAFLAGFLAGISPLLLQFGRCGTTEGFGLLPYLGLRGHELRTRMTQTLVQVASVSEFPHDVPGILLSRLCFQTVGEVAAGAVRALGPVVLTGLFPVLYILVNTPREKAVVIGALVVICAIMYGFTYWKGGDTAEALQVLLPYGFVYACPFMARLWRTWMGSWRNGRWRSSRGIYLHVILAFNVSFLVLLLTGAGETLSSVPSGIERVKAMSNRSRPSSLLASTLENIGDGRHPGSVLLCEGCKDRRSPALMDLADAGFHVVDLDARFHLFEDLRTGRTGSLESLFTLIPHQERMDMRLPRSGPVVREPPQSVALLVAHDRGRPREFIRRNADALESCIETLHDDPEDDLLLLRFHREPCLTFARFKGLFKASAGDTWPPSAPPGSGIMDEP